MTKGNVGENVNMSCLIRLRPNTAAGIDPGFIHSAQRPGLVHCSGVNCFSVLGLVVTQALARCCPKSLECLLEALNPPEKVWRLPSHFLFLYCPLSFLYNFLTLQLPFHRYSSCGGGCHQDLVRHRNLVFLAVHQTLFRHLPVRLSAATRLWCSRKPLQ